ncbi:MAG: 4-(cytidine 5'-diphospho)-2-C-methyl-D-erythritol kinase [bacterium]|nr:4-(cytidine 5'-diphospho)-2-C-methyl-D-erythritol kinase [bacterium]MBU1917824.1 4-(cytidine 5'-diphospho)-2-C-methyl-D-erythritol kinase [bacterium]
MKVIKLRSPAKINVRLDVLSKRHDGYHDLRMINTPVSIYDEIECELTEKGIKVECMNDSNVPDGEENIVYGVAKEILAYSNKNIGVHIRIKKNIPSAAGMGGGSSNAAAVLTGLNDLLKINLSKEKLMKIGLRFGADVPFFVMGSAAVAKGVGEDLVKIKKMPKLPLVVITPNISVSTKWAYEHYEAANDNKTPEPVNKDGSNDIPVQFATKKSVIKYLNNDLEQVTMRKYPVVTELKRILEKTGALAAQMTGSGPTVFGIYPNKEMAEIACKKIQAKVSDCRVFLAENLS